MSTAIISNGRDDAQPFDPDMLSTSISNPTALQAHRRTERDNVWATISRIQARQDTQQELMNLTRLGSFLQALEQLEDVVAHLPDLTIDVSSLWADVGETIRIASTWPYALDKVLEAYEEIGDSIPLVQEYDAIFLACPELRRPLLMMFKDIKTFHENSGRCLKSPVWRTTFKSTWASRKAAIKTIVYNLTKLKMLLADNSALLQRLSRFSYPMVINYHKHVAGHNYEKVEARDAATVVLGDKFADTNRYDDYQAEGDRRFFNSHLESLDDLRKSLNTKFESEDKRKSEELETTIKIWLAGPPASKYHEDASQRYQEYEGTGTWILQRKQVAEWIHAPEPSNSVLWMHGYPGAGKTVLASVIIDECCRQENFTTLYSYHKIDHERTHDFAGIVGGLLTQAVASRPDLAPFFDEERRRKGDPTLVTESTAKKLMDITCHSNGRLYIILDGIDECTQERRRPILDYFIKLVEATDQKEHGKVRLLVVSQNEPDIKRALQMAVDLEIDRDDARENNRTAHRADIYTYASHWASSIAGKFCLDLEQRDFVCNKVCTSAAGQFLYARLVMENLYAQPTLGKFKDELYSPSFPKDLSQAYQRIIERIKRNSTPDEWIISKRLLGWMTAALRPLKWHEMQGAISIDLEKEEPEVNFEDRQLRRHIEDICGSLVSVSGDRVSLVHATAKNFITDSDYIDRTIVECDLASLSLQYLALHWFDSDLSDSNMRFYICNGYYAFADYAVSMWMHHVRRALDCAKPLEDSSKSQDLETALQELIEATEYFVDEKYLQDLTGDTEVPSCDYTLSHDFIQVLKRMEATDETIARFKTVMVHIERRRLNHDVQARNRITPETLRSVIESTRSMLEEVYGAKATSKKEKDQLEIFYGDRVFRCGRTNCFYFHEGFKDKQSRNKHEARHDRPFQCEDADCSTAQFGFISKRDLEQHMLSFHPDAEQKGKQFKVPTPKPPITKYRCETCDKCFVRNAILKEHRLTHTGQKPFECSRCGKAFTRKNDVKRHEKIHDNRK